MQLASPDRRRLTVAGIVLAVVLFFALNTFGSLSLRNLKLDLTENHQFTLSQGTEQLLGKIQEPITLRLYASRSLRDANPFLGSYADRVHDLLRTYADASNGKITVEYIDPEPFSTEEDRAVGFGLQPIQSESGGGASGYLGIAGTNTTDDVDVIPVLSPDRESFLEYDLTRMVWNLAHPEKPVVALLTSLPMNGDPAQQYRPWQVMQELQEFFEVRTIGGDIDRIADDVAVLMLVHPQALSEKTLYAIDQFVMRGGKVLAFVDPHAEAQAVRRPPGMPEDTFSDLGKLLPAWGVTFDHDKIVADPDLARQVVFPSGGREQVIDYLPWLGVDQSRLAKDEVITAELNRVNLATAGFLKPREGATTSFTPLMRSSASAQVMDADKVRVYPDPYAIMRDYKPGGQELVLAARISGPVKSAFDKAPEGAGGGAEQLKESKSPAQIILIADSDLLDDRNWLANQRMLGQQVTVPLADNGNLVANALDYLVGSDALLSLRGRDVTLRPFTKVAEIRRAAEQQYRAKEQELQQKLDDLQQKLSALKPADSGAGEEGNLLSDAQKKEIESFRGQLLETRRELRDVQHALRKDIEDLRDRIRFINIAAVPLLVAALAIVMAVVQRARYRRRFDTTAHA
ncbi:Gldg family protein [Benzoatithermus flavus]|uniref:Gldg family protein n=1 Tax=Benzoatithermus flavus TaxID=3108223 RepID=A0ABU8XYX4_9PROT